MSKEVICPYKLSKIIVKRYTHNLQTSNLVELVNSNSNSNNTNTHTSAPVISTVPELSVTVVATATAASKVRPTAEAKETASITSTGTTIIPAAGQK